MLVGRMIRVPIGDLVLFVSVAVPDGPDALARARTAGIVVAAAIYRCHRLERLHQEGSQ